MMTLTRPLLASDVQLDTLQWRANPDRARHARWGSTRLQRLCMHQLHGWFADDDSQPHTLRGVLGRLLRGGHDGACIACSVGRFGPSAGGSSAAVCEACQSGQYDSKARACVRSAPPARQTKTPIRPPSVWTATQEHTLGVVRPRAPSA